MYPREMKDHIRVTGPRMYGKALVNAQGSRGRAEGAAEPIDKVSLPIGLPGSKGISLTEHTRKAEIAKVARDPTRNPANRGPAVPSPDPRTHVEVNTCTVGAAP